MEDRFKIKHDNQWILQKVNSDGTKTFMPRTTIHNGIITKHTIEFNQAINQQRNEWRENRKQKQTKISF